MAPLIEVVSSTTVARELGSTWNELRKFRPLRLAVGCCSSEIVRNPTLKLRPYGRIPDED
jgi:hypothetical protein